MKEIVLPASGDFARFERIKFSDVLAVLNAPHIGVALIARLVSIDGRKVDADYLDAMALADAMVLLNAINDELVPAGLAKGVA